ncbi:MAG: restriction endonuclease subunit S [Desulfobacteraceae bacterium]|nr:MAG: restriction endonuclease subunit S [Desulfobacteraceae bacterium]
MKRYPAYKDSGVEWIGEIPEHWDSWRIKSIVKNCVNGLWGDDLKGDDGDVVCVRVADFQYNSLCVSNNNFTIRNIPIDQQNGKILAPSDLLVEKSGGGEKQPVGRVVKYGRPEKAVCSNFIAKITTDNKKVDSVFSLYYFSDIYAKRVNTRSIKQTTGIQNLDFYAYSTEKMPIPSKEEQQSIANFLDHKTRLIDILIEKKQKQIELLQEQRTGIINHAVTKGLNHNVKMKETGIEWLGEVPEHWKTAKLGYYISILSGYAFPSTDFTQNASDNRLLRGINVGVSEIRWDDTVYWKREKDDCYDRFELKAGTLVAGMDRPWIKKGVRVAIISEIDLPCLLLQRVVAINTSKDLVKEYLYRILSSQLFIDYFTPSTTGVSVPHISPEQICNFKIPLPPFNEQQYIVTFLNRETTKLENLIDININIIEQLQEYRTTLISEVVTGKIDVREEVIP